LVDFIVPKARIGSDAPFGGDAMARGRGDRTAGGLGGRLRSAGFRRLRSAGFRRLLALLAFLPVASRAPMYSRLVWALVTDERTPVARKALLAGALGYIVLGRDIVPDDAPIVGGIDDLIVVVLAVDLFLDGVPEDLLHEKLDSLGIESAAFERDVAQIRRLTPGPVRRTIRRLSAAISFGGAAWRETGIGPRLRTWIKEDRTA
jgi:uncharacterized membrane protein YkvA (DUF1232 family)